MFELSQINLNNPSTVIKLAPYQKEENYEEWLLIERYLNLFISRFKYKNLPKEIPPDIPFRWLFWWRNIAFSHDDILGYFALPPTAEGDLDLYWRPQKWVVTGGNGFRKELTPNNSVIIWNDKGRTCPIFQIYPTIKRMADIIRTIDINLNAQKTPFAFSGPKDQLLTLLNLYKEISGNKPVLMMSKKQSAALQETKVFDTQVEFKGLELMRLLQIYENQILTYMGVNNVNVEKRERLVTDEADANTELTQLNLANALREQEEGLEKFNKIFGTNIDIEVVQRVTFEQPDENESVNINNQPNEKTAQNRNNDVTGGNK